MTTKSPVVELYELRTALEQRDREIATLKADLSKATEQLTSTSKELGTLKLRDDFIGKARKVGVKEGACIDMFWRALRDGEWGYDPKGKLRCKDESGFFNEDVFEWIRKTKHQVPTYFEDAELTENLSAADSGKVGAAAKREMDSTRDTDPELLRIFDPKTGNFTKQCLLYKENPDLARRIANQVGNKIFDRIEEQDRRFGR